MRLYDPPAALLPKGDQYSVELAGAKCLLAIDEEKEFIVISKIFDELSEGKFWLDNPSIADQIEKINIKYENSEALYDPDILSQKIMKTLKTIQNRGLIFFGVASFEGNAFETTVFDEFELDIDDQNKLLNLYKESRVKNAFPNLKKELDSGNPYVEINFFGQASKFFTLANKKQLNDIAAIIFPYQGYASGIVTCAQGAANFILLTDNIFKTKNLIKSRTDVHIDKQNLEQMFDLIKKEVLATPISWFKIDMGLNGIEKLDGWEEIKNREDVVKAKKEYLEYLRNLIIKREKRTIEDILDKDIGKPINIAFMSEDEIEEDLETCMYSLNSLNEMDEENKSVSLFFEPPKILFAYGDVKKAAIGGSISLLSVDVGANICCISDIQEYISWCEYYQDEFSQDTDENVFFNITEDQNFLELENPVQLRDIYKDAFQRIMKGSEAFLGVLELESNAFGFSLFQELNLEQKDLKIIQKFYKNKISRGKYPKLKDSRINVKWVGKGKENFTFSNEFPSILDIITKINTDQFYNDKYACGIVCTSGTTSLFFILGNNYFDKTPTIDKKTLNKMYKMLENSDLTPLCWFKINLGMDSLKMHRFWKDAYQYDTLRRVLEAYKAYEKEEKYQLKKEENYRIY